MSFGKNRPDEIEIKYSEATKLRVSVVTAWLIEYEPYIDSQSRDVLIADANISVEKVIEMVKSHSGCAEFRVQNITVGCFPLLTKKQAREQIPDHLQDGWYSSFHADARSVDSEGMVQL